MELVVNFTKLDGSTRHCRVRITEKDLELSEKQFLERFIKPALYALEQRIVND